MNIENKKTRIERVRKVTTEQAEKDLQKSAGILTHAVTYLEQMYGIKITRQALSYRVKKSKRLQQAQQEARETVLDLAEGVIFSEIKKGNWKVSLSVLRTLGKNRGYAEKVIHTDKEETEQQSNAAALLTEVLEKVWEGRNDKTQ